MNEQAPTSKIIRFETNCEANLYVCGSVNAHPYRYIYICIYTHAHAQNTNTTRNNSFSIAFECVWVIPIGYDCIAYITYLPLIHTLHKKKKQHRRESTAREKKTKQISLKCRRQE